MRNKYPGICYRCGEMVNKGAGHFERIKGGGWRVQHAECAIKHRNKASSSVNPVLENRLNLKGVI